MRSIAVLPVSVSSAGKGKGKAHDSKARSYVAVTISSDGFIRTFDLSPIVNKLSSEERTLAEYAEQITSVESNAQFDTKGTRLTCLTAVGVAGNANAGADQDEEEDADVLGSDEDATLQAEEDSEEEEEVDEEAEDEELKALEKALKDAQEKGLDLGDLEELLDGGEEIDLDDDEDDEEDDEDDEEAEEEEEDEDEGELE